MSKLPPPSLGLLDQNRNCGEQRESPGMLPLPRIDSTPYFLSSGDAEVNVRKFDTNATPSPPVKFAVTITWPV